MLLSERQEILDRLQTLSEARIRRLLVNYSRAELGDSDEIHGAGEHGVDVVTLLKPEHDPLGLEQILLFQVKKRNITLSGWRKHLAGQLSEMYFRTIRALNINEKSPRRIVLVYSRMTPAVHQAISDWNTKMPIPIELLSIDNLSSLLARRGYRAREIRRLSR